MTSNIFPVPSPSPRDWTQDFQFENGNYMNQCCSCKKGFFGHKRRVICYVCFMSQFTLNGILKEMAEPCDLAETPQ